MLYIKYTNWINDGGKWIDPVYDQQEKKMSIANGKTT